MSIRRRRSGEGLRSAAMEAVLVRETRPWPPKRVASTLAGLVLVVVTTSAGNVAWSAYQERQATSASCAALGRPVPGLGTTRTALSWATVLTTWHEDLGPVERRDVTISVSFNAVGPGVLFDDVADEVRPAVDYLYARIRLAPTPDVLDTRALDYVVELERYLLDTCGIAP
jgi:hypothetical protein